MSETIVAGIIAGIVSLIIAGLSFLSNRRETQNQIRQSQISPVLAKRIEIYPRLWEIHVKYETNWEIENKVKDSDWAQSYLNALNEFNLIGGLFFSEGLYQKFADLRDLLIQAVDETEGDEEIADELIEGIRSAVYGEGGNLGLAFFEKDDLGSYGSTYIQERPQGT